MNFSRTEHFLLFDRALPQESLHSLPIVKIILTIWKAIQISNNLDPDYTWRKLGPDLDQHCFSKVINRRHNQVKSPTETTKWYVHPFLITLADKEAEL